MKQLAPTVVTVHVAALRSHRPIDEIRVSDLGEQVHDALSSVVGLGGRVRERGRGQGLGRVGRGVCGRGGFLGGRSRVTDDRLHFTRFTVALTRVVGPV